MDHARCCEDRDAHLLPESAVVNGHVEMRKPAQLGFDVAILAFTDAMPALEICQLTRLIPTVRGYGGDLPRLRHAHRLTKRAFVGWVADAFVKQKLVA